VRACSRVRSCAYATACRSSRWRAERQRNVRGAFRAADEVAGCALLVIDDVMTTGATLDEVARVVKRAGAARVANPVVARTP